MKQKIEEMKQFCASQFSPSKGCEGCPKTSLCRSERPRLSEAGVREFEAMEKNRYTPSSNCRFIHFTKLCGKCVNGTGEYGYGICSYGKKLTDIVECTRFRPKWE